MRISHFYLELVRGLLDIEYKQQNKTRRSNLFKDIENVFNRTFYEDAEDAISRAKGIKRMATIIDRQKNGEINVLETLEEVKNNLN